MAQRFTSPVCRTNLETTSRRLLLFLFLALAAVAMAGAESDSSRKSTSILLRFFLVRHGLAQANVEGLVAGQNDTPLTPTGIQHAEALGRTLRDFYFWRVYSSDLSRAHETCQAILRTAEDGGDATAAAVDISSNGDTMMNSAPTRIQLDARLRELAKGARESLPKAWSEQQALQERERLQWKEDVPALESLDHGWERMLEWWDHVVADAVQSSGAASNNEDQQSELSKGNPGSDSNIGHKRLVLNILVVTHSGILRVFLERLLGRERLQAHPNSQYDSDDRFILPNTSLTILELEATSAKDVNDDDRDETVMSRMDDHDRIRIQRLTDTAHYANMLEANLVTTDDRR